jgi:hypothetical protein
MFGTYPFGVPYFGQAPNIDPNDLERLDAGDASIRVLHARNTVRELTDRLTFRALRARRTVKETPDQ